MTFLGVEIIDTKQQPDLFVDIEPLEIPSDAILLDNRVTVLLLTRTTKTKDNAWHAVV